MLWRNKTIQYEHTPMTMSLYLLGPFKPSPRYQLFLKLIAVNSLNE